VTAGADVDAILALPGYARTFSLVDRSAMAAILFPMGRVSGEVTAAAGRSDKSANGFGDPMIEFNINVSAAGRRRISPTSWRYEPGSLSTLSPTWRSRSASTTSDQPLNLGRTAGMGAWLPIIWQLGPWVPGRRTTLEFLPPCGSSGKTTTYVGQTMKTDPIFQLDAHLTRRLHRALLGVLDAAWY